MNEDYLWDKSGDDPEIERLENTLAVFRYRETEAPVPQMAKPVTVVETASRWKFYFAYAFAALAIVVILAGMWIRISSGPGGSEKRVASVAPARVNSETRDGPRVTADHVVPIDRVQPVSRRSSPLRISAKRTAALTHRRSRTSPERSQDPNGTAALTKEERYAYEQLMLALSITGSKLKIVKDTINGIEDSENALKENRR